MSKTQSGVVTLAATLLLLSIASFARAAPPMLRTSGRNIINTSNQIVRLRGVNLGGWLVFEKWMTPMDRGSLVDHYQVQQKLDQRFGVATEQALLDTYQANWITTTDLDNIKNRGYNCVRVPVWWGNFFTLSSYGDVSGWRGDAGFSRLDWLINNCATRNLYVIIDMHGVVGGQSTSDTCGQSGVNQYWSNGSYQGRTAWLWWQIANRYKGNPTVAGYDLINEPIGAPNKETVWARYNDLYNIIRGVDSGHMIIMEATFGNWNWDMLPNPSTYGWTNVVYETHEYQWGGNGTVVQNGAQNQVNDFNNHSSWNVPGYVGEFNCFGNGSAVWSNCISRYNNGGLNWTMWTYKATHGLNPDSWGWYDPYYWPTTPNISTDSSSTISNNWLQWKTSTSFSVNNTIGM